ncbi:MAG: dihydrodipicolinate synthase family protein [Dorea sp.]|nr:dihydrodipicolinate synthase family protein [Dorea sp.]
MIKSLKDARGSGAIPMTPFTEDYRIDIPILEKELEFICKSHVGNICTPVMVSEFMSLSEDERRLMIRIPVEISNGRIPIIANAAATNIYTAISYAQYAEKIGADAIISMAPWCGDSNKTGVIEYFKALASNTGLPVMIQNISLPGVSLSVDEILELCASVPNIRWVKQEVSPGPLSIDELNQRKTSNLEGIMSGFGGAYTPLDFANGATATIQACELCDVSQKVWNLFYDGKEQEARQLHHQILPALQAELLYGTAFAKEIMVRRGIFKNTLMRNKSTTFSASSLHEIDRLWQEIEPLLITKI